MYNKRISVFKFYFIIYTLIYILCYLFYGKIADKGYSYFIYYIGGMPVPRSVIIKYLIFTRHCIKYVGNA